MIQTRNWDIMIQSLIDKTKHNQRKYIFSPTNLDRMADLMNFLKNLQYHIPTYIVMVLFWGVTTFLGV